MKIKVDIMVYVLLFFGIFILGTPAAASCPSEERFCTKKMDITTKSDFVMSYNPILCDAKTGGYRWIVIQSRFLKDTNFNRNWTDYKNGFGTPCKTDFWIGNEMIYQITSMGEFQLRIDLTFLGNAYYGTYDNFKVDSERNNYKMSFGTYSGNVSDDFSAHNNMMFSTPDRDNDSDEKRFCAQIYGSGWWYADCHNVHLNGQFDSPTLGTRVTWFSISSNWHSLNSTEMKIRRVK
ncbi:BgMsFReDn31 [Biomphalaria glabrata]|nr:Techylectin-5B-like Resistant factor [Biomphalaria glabrata]